MRAAVKRMLALVAKRSRKHLAPAASRMYTCAACGRTFVSTWDDWDSQAERCKNGWGCVPCEVVCDDCYRLVMGRIKN